ncbi:MAG: hypothetical protein P1U88_19130 [Thalassobaculaceae bacterium]|nr:hypothetical protein [Thalassobaculaceae bacterium]
MKRQYGWRDVAAVLGVYTIVLQLGLGIVAGLAGASIAREQQASGDDIASLALQVCSPAGLIQLAAEADGRDAPPRGGPVCPGCLFAHAGPIPPVTVVAAVPQRARLPRLPMVTDSVGPAPIALISKLNPRAPPRLST